jgi:hypothetical protein
LGAATAFGAAAAGATAAALEAKAPSGATAAVT